MSTEGILLVAATTVIAVLLGALLLMYRALAAAQGRRDQAAIHQSVFNGAAVAFASAHDLQSAAQAAVRTAVALTGTQPSWATFAIMDGAEPLVVARADAVLTVEDDADSRSPNRIVVAEPLATSDQGVDRGVTTAAPGSPPWIIPVYVNGEERGDLVVSHGTAGDVPDWLVSVADQMGLAVHRAEAADELLRGHDRKFQSLVQNSSDAVTLLGADGVVHYQSASGQSLLGHPVDDLLGRTFEWLTHPDDMARSRALFIKVVTGGQGTRVSYECRFRHADGRWRQVESVMTNLLDDPDVAAIVSNSRDVTDRRVLEQQLSHQAFHDTLTGLANRDLFLDRVAHALDRADRGAGPVAVMFVDVDDFKIVNDSLGHHLGDEVLVAVGERLTAATRTGDTVARIGGDEFALLLDSGEMPAAAEVVAGRIASQLSTPIITSNEDISVQVSIGIALGQPPDDEPGGLLRDADLAMYLAKRNGKGRFEMFHPTMHEAAVRRLEITADLRRALTAGEFEVFYQPIVNVGTAATIGAEALVRWSHPSRGLVSPADFISVAESTGLIVPLGKWVLGEAGQRVQSWKEAGIVSDSFYISVNLSARQLQDPGLLDDVAFVLRETGLAADAVVLEVTESIIMDDLESALECLHALKDLGLRLAIDDFGTGYSSLSYLRNFPMDVVKIDKSFIDRVAVDSEGAALVRGMIDLSRALGLATIAEGVEGDEQLAILHEFGCDSVQGYLFAPPMPADDFARSFMARGNLAASTPWPGPYTHRKRETTEYQVPPGGASSPRAVAEGRR
jgi:diguanylate cyclase (GGDEF)-like protein/PAS domain S-box-containing protein